MKRMKNTVSIHTLALAVGGMLLSLSTSAQQFGSSVDVPIQDEVNGWDSEQRTGFVFGLNIGAYFGNKNSANFYNGDGTGSINDNQAQKLTIEERLLESGTPTIQQVTNAIGAESFFIPFDSSPLAMRYNPGIMIGLRVGYRFNNENGFFLDANVATLKAADKFTLQTNLLPDPMQGTADVRLYNIIGEESRLNITLGYRAAVVINDGSNWYLEGGASMLAIRLEQNFLEIEGQTYNLWVDRTFGPNNINGPTANLTSTGYGVFLGTGVEMFFNDRYEVDLGMRLVRDKVIMGDFEDNLINTQVFISATI